MKRLVLRNSTPGDTGEDRVLYWKEPRGVASLPLARGPEDEDAADEAAMAWTKSFGRRPVREGRSLRDILVYKGIPLWWAAEIYLYYQTRATHYVRLVETFARILERERPDEVAAPELEPVERLLLHRVATRMGVLSESAPLPGGLDWKIRTLSIESRWNSAKTVATSLKASLGKRPHGPRAGTRVAVLSHAAFWRTGSDGKPYEHYLGRLLPELGAAGNLAPFVVGVGPRSAFRRRGLLARLGEWVRLGSREPYVPIYRYTDPRVAREALRATGWMRREWNDLRRLPALLEGFTHRGVHFFDLAGPDLAATLLLQVPWAYRSFLEMERALQSSRSQALVLYAESSGWGRVALEAARARGVPSVAIQHGILYPKYFSYRHDPDEGGCPRPTATALFGEAARDFLTREGRYAPESLVTTGSPKFDALLETARTWDRGALRGRLGASPEQTLIVVASRFRGILPTHRSIGREFRTFLEAVARREAFKVLVKPHPAEGPEEYRQAIKEVGAASVEVLAPDADLTELLWASDCLVTVESLSAVEALVLGRRVLVLNMPSNLKELVDAGVAMGVEAGADPGPALDRLRGDPATGSALDQARERYLDRVAMGVDGHATERILELIRQKAAEGPRAVKVQASVV
jgi:hypothetical protein